MRFWSRLILLTLLAVFASANAFAQGYSNTNPYVYWVPPGACNTAVSGSSTGTQGLTIDGASNTPVVRAQTAAAGGTTHTFICNITPPNSTITTGNGISIVDATFFYSPQSGIGVQAAVLASGTINGSIVFSFIAYPTPASGETASSVTPVRADSGTMTITPVAASFNIATTTAGAYFSAKFAPASGTLLYKTDLRQLLLTVTLRTDGAATIITSPGVLVHFRGQ